MVHLLHIGDGLTTLVGAFSTRESAEAALAMVEKGRIRGQISSAALDPDSSFIEKKIRDKQYSGG